MKAGEMTDEQIVAILQEAEKGEKKLTDPPAPSLPSHWTASLQLTLRAKERQRRGI